MPKLRHIIDRPLTSDVLTDGAQPSAEGRFCLGPHETFVGSLFERSSSDDRSSVEQTARHSSVTETLETLRKDRKIWKVRRPEIAPL